MSVVKFKWAKTLNEAYSKEFKVQQTEIFKIAKLF